ncbi:hypothetical protein Moror_5811 [Moniliophthora roreri MCA 2997]|uniref:Uncharacterized protein n=2 Tax=Moniliophthora roreri TaxID=221103 RepID=V2WK72_MONRO|nr:hypothetical protein Moror_5811 [Moniliophthora roreri MCA 2997]
MTAIKGSNKRRKISSSKSSFSSISTIDSSRANSGLPTGISATTRLTCVSCHRGLNASSSSKASCPVFCARCNSPTCTICSRTCTGPVPATANAISPLSEFGQDSVPETPRLTWSTTSPASSPSPPSLVSSPRRFALAINAANTNTNANIWMNFNTSTNKRKISDQEDESDEGKARGSGCGRVVCRNCCTENAQSIVCHDCKASA